MAGIKLFITLSLLFGINFDGAAHDDPKEKVTKRIFLVRHAKSSHDDPSLKDFDRPLNERGKRDAPAMGSRLINLGVAVDHIISSPARRTRQTAKLLLDRMAIGIEKVNWDQRIYRCASSVLRQRISEIGDGFNNVMIFGHNPAITAAANFYQKDTTLENVPTTGVVAIEFKIASWTELDSVKGKLLFVERPKR